MSNIKSGFYKVEFHAALPGAGGIISVENGNIRGGDNGYLYSGTMIEDGPRISAKITVSALSKGATSVFGTIGDKFVLNLTGTVDGLRFELSGPAPIPGAQGIKITGAWIADF